MRSLWLVQFIWAATGDELSAALNQLNVATPNVASTNAPAAGDSLAALLGQANPLSNSILTSGTSALPDLSQLLDLSSLNSLANTLNSSSNNLLTGNTGLESLTGQLDAATNTLNSLSALSKLSGDNSGLAGLDLTSLANGMNGLGNLTNQLDSMNSLTQQLQSLTSGLLPTTNTSNTADLLSVGSPTILGQVSDGNNHNNAVLSGLVNAFIQNGYLNQAGQTAIKMSGFAQDAYNYPDLVSALSGMTPCVNSNGELTSAVRSALSQMGIEATYPEDLVAYAMSKGFGVRRRLSETATLKDSIEKFNHAISSAIDMQKKAAAARRLQASNGYGYPAYHPYSNMMSGMPYGGGASPYGGGASPYGGGASPNGGGASPYGGPSPYGMGQYMPYGYPYMNPYLNPAAYMNAYHQMSQASGFGGPSSQVRGMDQKAQTEGPSGKASTLTTESSKKLLMKDGPSIVPIPNSQYPELASLADKEAIERLAGSRARANMIASPTPMSRQGKSTGLQSADVAELLGRMTESRQDQSSFENFSDDDFHHNSFSPRQNYGQHMSPYGAGLPRGVSMMGNNPMGNRDPMMGGNYPNMGSNYPMMGGPSMGGDMNFGQRLNDQRQRMLTATEPRKLSNWLDDAFNKVISGVQNSNPEWKGDVQNAANDLASQLHGLAEQLQNGNLPDKLEEWFKSASDSTKAAFDEAGRHRRLQAGYNLGMPLLNSLTTPLVGGISSLTDPLMTNLGLGGGNTMPVRTSYMPQSLSGDPMLSLKEYILSANPFGSVQQSGSMLNNGALNIPGLQTALSSLGLRRRLSDSDIDVLTKRIQELSHSAQASGRSYPGGTTIDSDRENATATTLSAPTTDNAMQNLGLGDLSALMNGLSSSDGLAGLDLNSLLSGLGSATATLAPAVMPLTVPAPTVRPMNVNNLDLSALLSGAGSMMPAIPTLVPANLTVESAQNVMNQSANDLMNSANLSNIMGTAASPTGVQHEVNTTGSSSQGNISASQSSVNSPLVDLNSIASSLGSSNLDISNMLSSLSKSPVDLNQLMGQLGSVDLNRMVEDASKSNVDLNAAAGGLSQLNINNLLSGLGDSSLDLNKLTSGLLSGDPLDVKDILKTDGTSNLSGLLANPDFSKMLDLLNQIPTLPPVSGTNATRVLLPIQELLQHQTSAIQQGLLETKKPRRLALQDFYNTARRRLTPQGLGQEDTAHIKPQPVDIDFDQMFDFSDNGQGKFVTQTGDLGFRWAFNEATSLVAPIMACWSVDDMSASEDDWPSFVVESVSLDFIDESTQTNVTSIDLIYTEAENLFRYYGKDWNKPQATQRRHNRGCTWIPMCALHDSLNRIQSRGPVTALIVIIADKVPPSKEISIPKARVVVRAVAEQGTWQAIPVDNSSRNNDDFMLPATAEIRQTFQNTPLFASELPRPADDSTQQSVGGFSVSGYAVVASAESEGLTFVFDQADWSYIPERARAAYGRILDQLKMFDDSQSLDPQDQFGADEAEYEASAIAMFNSKKDLPVTVPEFTFMPRIVLEASATYPSDGTTVVIQRCLPMSTGSSTNLGLFGAGSDPLSTTVLELLYASAGASHTNIRMKSYLEAAPIQALVSSQEGFSTFDMRDTLMDNYRDAKWTVNVTLSPLNSA